MAKKRPAQPNQSIERAITCLIDLATLGRPITNKEMSERLGVERTKAARMLGTLAYLGMAERLPNLSYVPGPGIHVLSAMSLRGSGLLRHALPHIQTIEEKWGVHAGFGVLWRDQVSYLYHSGGDRDMAEAIGGHGLHPADQSSIGKVLLAQKEDAEIKEILSERLTKKELVGLMGEIRDVRKRGYFLNPETVTMTVGTPATAALAFIGKEGQAEKSEFAEDVQAAVEAIERKIQQTGKKSG